MNHAKAVLVVFVLIVPTSLLGENSDPQALALAARSVIALTGSTAITDVTLTGNATWTVGDNNDSGPAILKALGNGDSSVDLQLSQEIALRLETLLQAAPLENGSAEALRHRSLCTTAGPMPRGSFRRFLRWRLHQITTWY
jgi:hypothetical protein